MFVLNKKKLRKNIYNICYYITYPFKAFFS